MKLTALNDLDARSAGGGFFTLGIDAGDGGLSALSIGVDGAGRVVVAVGSPRAMTVHRFLPSGVADAAFGTGGVVVTPLGGNSGPLGRSIVVERGGGVIVGGDVRDPDGVYRRGGVVRLEPSGALDMNFGGPGVAILLEPGAPTDVDLKPRGVGLVAAPPGECEGEFLAGFSQDGGKKHLFH